MLLCAPVAFLTCPPGGAVWPQGSGSRAREGAAVAPVGILFLLGRFPPTAAHAQVKCEGFSPNLSRARVLSGFCSWYREHLLFLMYLRGLLCAVSARELFHSRWSPRDLVLPLWDARVHVL